MKSVMSWKIYQKLNLSDLDTTRIPHVVGASGESLGTRGRTKYKININGKIFYQTFIVCEHLERPIILGRDFLIQNCIGISWTKTNTHKLTQNNEVCLLLLHGFWDLISICSCSEFCIDQLQIPFGVQSTDATANGGLAPKPPETGWYPDAFL